MRKRCKITVIAIKNKDHALKTQTAVQTKPATESAVDVADVEVEVAPEVVAVAGAVAQQKAITKVTSQQEVLAKTIVAQETIPKVKRPKHLMALPQKEKEVAEVAAGDPEDLESLVTQMPHLGSQERTDLTLLE
jgi:hypothetical protein